LQKVLEQEEKKELELDGMKLRELGGACMASVKTLVSHRLWSKTVSIGFGAKPRSNLSFSLGFGAKP